MPCELPDDCQVVLLIGHAPGVSGLVLEVTDPAASIPEAVGAIESRFPAAALAQLEFDADWSQLSHARLRLSECRALASDHLRDTPNMTNQ
jgi:phosphohistidine phosphatase SixA